MCQNLIMFDSCMIVFAKNADSIMNKESFIQFLAPQYRVLKYHLAILACLQSITPSNNDATSQIKQKAALKAI